MPELEKLYSTEVGRLSLKGLLCLSHVVCKLHAVFQGFILRKVVQSVCNVRAARIEASAKVSTLLSEH